MAWGHSTSSLGKQFGIYCSEYPSGFTVSGWVFPDQGASKDPPPDPSGNRLEQGAKFHVFGSHPDNCLENGLQRGRRGNQRPMSRGVSGLGLEATAAEEGTVPPAQAAVDRGFRSHARGRGPRLAVGGQGRSHGPACCTLTGTLLPSPVSPGCLCPQGTFGSVPRSRAAWTVRSPRPERVITPWGSWPETLLVPSLKGRSGPCLPPAPRGKDSPSCTGPWEPPEPTHMWE